MPDFLTEHLNGSNVSRRFDKSKPGLGRAVVVIVTCTTRPQFWGQPGYSIKLYHVAKKHCDSSSTSSHEWSRGLELWIALADCGAVASALRRHRWREQVADVPEVVVTSGFCGRCCRHKWFLWSLLKSLWWEVNISFANRAKDVCEWSYVPAYYIEDVLPSVNFT